MDTTGIDEIVFSTAMASLIKTTSTPSSVITIIPVIEMEVEISLRNRRNL